MAIFALLIPSTEDKIILLIIFLLGIICAWVYCFRAPIKITIDSAGLELRNVITKERFYAHWTDFSAAYRLKGWKGHNFILFSQTEMDQAQQKDCWKRVYGFKLRKSLPVGNGNVIFGTSGYLGTINRMIDGKLTIEEGARVE